MRNRYLIEIRLHGYAKIPKKLIFEVFRYRVKDVIKKESYLV